MLTWGNNIEQCWDKVILLLIGLLEVWNIDNIGLI